MRLQDRITTFATSAALLTLGTSLLSAAEEEHGHAGYSLTTDLTFWAIIAFIGFVVALKFLGWGAFTSGLKDREETEKDLIAKSEGLRARAAAELTKRQGQMEAVDEHIREVLEEANRDANHTREDILGVAKQEADAAQARAEVEVDRVKDQSLNEIFETVSVRVAELAEQRISERLGQSEQQRLMDEAVDSFVSANA